MISNKLRILRRAFGVSMLVLCSMLSVNKTFATHFAAADLTVTYIETEAVTGYHIYELKLVLYKACEWSDTTNSADLPTSAGIGISSVNSNVNRNRNIAASPLDTLDQLCPNFSADNSCRKKSSPWPAFVRAIYADTIRLHQESDWEFCWTSGARNDGILNGFANQQIAVKCGLNNLNEVNSSTPRFTVDPTPYICVNQPAIFLNQAQDFDSDSLDVYAQDPWGGCTGQLTYGNTYPPNNTPYSLTDPIASPNNPYTVDPFTGTATFTPTVQGKFVLAFRCDSYNRLTGERTGYTMRDVQVIVLTCASPPPNLGLPYNMANGKLIDTTGKVTILTCPNSELKFDIDAESLTATNAVEMESNSSVTIPASTYTIANNGSPKATGTFTWTPTLANLGEHSFVITAKDSTCNAGQPIVLKSFRVVLIRVVPGVNAGPDLLICEGRGRQINATGPDGFGYHWLPTTGLSDANTLKPIAEPAITTSYVLEAAGMSQIAGCKNTDTITVVVDQSNTLDAKPDNPAILCHPGYLQLDAKVTGGGPRTNLSCGTSNPVTCAVKDSTTIFGNVFTGGFDANPGLNDTALVNPNDYRTFATDVLTSKQQFLLNRHDMMNWGLFSSTIYSLSFEAAIDGDPNFVYNNFKISLKCIDSTSLRSTRQFETGMVPVYTATGPVTIKQGWNQFVFDSPYSWDTTKNLVVEICYSNNPAALGTADNPTITYTKPALEGAIVRLSNIPASGSTVADTCDATIANVSHNRRPVFAFTFCEAPPGQFVYTWYPGTFLSDSTIQSPLAYVPKSIEYHIVTRGRNNCILRDSVDIFVPNQHYRVSPSDTSICYGEGAPINIYTNGEIKQPEDGGMKYYQWLTSWYKLVDDGSLNNVTRPGVIASPKANVLYYILVVDSVGCRDTLQAYVEVRPLPKVDILGNDTLVKFGTSLQLLANGARLYSWDPVSSLNNPNISHPIATPLEPTMYTVTGIGANGCRASDTLKVDLDMRDKLFIPTAFSPNGDGKNDVFRVANLTFQKLVEFRVYNRWGQEVYSTTDNKKGWDGTWKGAEQEIGVYQYLIRVAYPDGYLDTYKGDVTLVR